jgi:hypothetical protein
MRIALPVLLVLVGCTACSTGPDEDAPPAVEISVIQVDLDANVVRATMRNVGGQTLTFGPCSLGLESGQTGEWVWVPKDYACDTVLGFLKPGKSYTFDGALPSTEAGCPLRVAAALGVEKVLDLAISGHSGDFCPKAD